MDYQNRRVAGIWLDKNHAYLITTPTGTNEGDFAVVKKFDFKHLAAYGSSEHTQHRKESGYRRAFFKELSAEMEKFDVVLLFGPGKTQEQLRNFVNENQLCKRVVIELAATDHQTKNQVLATVRKHFKNK